MNKQTDKNKSKANQIEKQALAEAEREAEVLTERIMAGARRVPVVAATPAPSANSTPGQGRPHRAIKLGVDVHADRYVVVRQIDGNAPQPPQRFTPADFLEWAKKQLTLAERVFSCYEAGPFGYSLHRALQGLGIANYVVRPRDWDEYGQDVKTDQRDAKQLVLGLDATWRAMRMRSAWCGCPARRRNKPAAARGNGRVCRSKSSAGRRRGAVTRCIMVSAWPVNGGERRLGKN